MLLTYVEKQGLLALNNRQNMGIEQIKWLEKGLERINDKLEGTGTVTGNVPGIFQTIAKITKIARNGAATFTAIPAILL